MTKLQKHLEQRMKEHLTLEKINANIQVILGGTANLLVLKYGKDLILVDSGQSKDIAKIKNILLNEYGSDKVSVIINTHFHPDHCENNNQFGDNIRVVAHQNCINKIAITENNYGVGTRKGINYLAISFTDTMSFYYEEDSIDLVHYENCHTDNDIIVWFKKSNIVHLGDLMTNGYFPYLDYSNGGNINNWHIATKKILSNIDNDTIIIPGHGPVGDKKDFEQYVNMMSYSIEYFKDLIKKNKSVDEVKGMQLENEMEKWARDKGNKDLWIENVMKSLYKDNA